MTASAKILASGPGWRVQDVVCTGTAADRPFEEEHRDFVIAAVSEGTFRYRSRQGAAIMAPGGVLFGNRGACFECGHEHAAGDRCLSFHFSPELMQTIIADVPGATKLSFETPSLPPCEALAPVIAEAEAARERTDALGLEEIALTLAGAAVSAAAGAGRRRQGPSRRDEKRVSEAIRLIEAEAERPISLGRSRAADLARRVGALHGDQSVPLPAQLPRGGGHDALPVPAEDAAAPRRCAPAHHRRACFSDRL
jgi:AraC family transcriptional regulator